MTLKPAVKQNIGGVDFVIQPLAPVPQHVPVAIPDVVPDVVAFAVDVDELVQCAQALGYSDADITALVALVFDHE